MGAGRRRRRARRARPRRLRRRHIQRHPGRRGRAGRPGGRELILTEGPAAVQRLIAARRRCSTPARTGCCAPGRAGTPPTGSSTPAATPPARRSNARCWRSAGLPAVLAEHQALDVVLDGTGRARGLSVLAPDGRVGLIRARRRRAGHRRRRPPVRGHHQPGRGHRRRPGDGAAGRGRAGRRRVHAVPPDRAVDRARRPGPPAAGHRGGPRRGRRADRRRGRADHAAACTRWPTWHRETWCRWPSPAAWPQAPGGVGDHVFLDATGIAPAVFRAPVPDGVRGLRAGRRRPRPGSRSRSRRPRTTTAAACSPTWTAAPRCPACSRSARSPGPGCTAPTGWRRTRCWRAW